MRIKHPKVSAFEYGLSLLALLALLAIGPACSGGDTENTRDLDSILPRSSLPEGFEQEVSRTQYNRAKIWDYIGPNADVYLYNGFQNLLVARYLNDGGDTLTCEIFEFSSPLESFGLYSNLHEFWYPAVELPGEGYLRGDTLTFLKGNILGRLHSRTVAATELIPAAQEMCEEIGSDIEKPKEFAYFPDGYEQHSERVTLDDFLGQTELDGFRSMSYVLGDDTLRLYMHLNAGHLLAEVVRAYMGGTGVVKEMVFDGFTQGFVAENEELGSLYCTIRGPVLVMLIGDGDRTAIDSLTKAAFAKVDKLGLPDSTATQK
ncbi:MAG: DUF6599 family protein [bacterium]